MNDKITEIKEALGKATPGPWEIEKSYNGYMVVQQKTFEVICRSKLHEKTEDNQKLISNAPEYITYLLQLVETQHRYLERISVTFGEFECQRLAKEAMDKVNPFS